MSIRMKEWGMMRAPADAAHIPVQGLTGWDSAARNVGEGVSAILKNSVELVQGQERVEETGELARFSQRLHEIDAETRAELAERDVQDWDYAWRAASGPRLAEAVAELPPSARQAGAEIAQDYSKRASLEAYKERSVQKLKKARSQWQQQVDTAVEQGDEKQALLWLQQGKDVFVAPAQEEEMGNRICSRARLFRWEREFSANPLQTLERWRLAHPEDLPGGEEELQRLGSLAETYKRESLKALAGQVAAQSDTKEEIPESVWRQAHRAGLISDSQLEGATASYRSLKEVDRCRWFRRVDEVEDDERSRISLQMDIATAPIPAQDRAELLQRLASTAGVSRDDRQTLSRNLWNLYNAGAFGCPGDAMAGRRMAAMQRNGAQLLATRGAEAAAAWIQGQSRRTGHWVRFSDMHQPNA